MQPELCLLYLFISITRQDRLFFDILHASQSYILPVGVGYLEHNTQSMFSSVALSQREQNIYIISQF